MSMTRMPASACCTLPSQSSVAEPCCSMKSGLGAAANARCAEPSGRRHRAGLSRRRRPQLPSRHTKPLDTLAEQGGGIRIKLEADQEIAEGIGGTRAPDGGKQRASRLVAVGERLTQGRNRPDVLVGVRAGGGPGSPVGGFLEAL